MVTMWKPGRGNNNTVKSRMNSAARGTGRFAFLKKLLKSRFFKRFVMFLGGFLILLFVLLFVFVYIPFTRVYADYQDFAEKTYNIRQAFVNQDLDQIKINVTAAQTSLNRLEESVSTNFSLFRSIPFTGRYMEDADKFFRAGDHALSAAYIAVNNAEPFADVLGFKTADSPDTTGISNQERIFNLMQILPEYAPALDEVAVELKEVDKLLSEVDPNRYPEYIRNRKVRENIIVAQDTVRRIHEDMPLIKEGLIVLPEFMGFDEPKVYMVLMANENEQRMSGGFNTYVVLMEVDKGVAEVVYSIDTYDIDRDRNDLKQTQPPDFIKDLLGQPVLYARDATSTSPDFVVAYETLIDNFWNRHGGLPTNIDGVFQVNTTVVERLLKVLGPVTVEGRYFQTDTGTVYVEERTFTSENAFVELERIAGEELSEVQGRKDIITFLMVNLMYRAFNAPPETLAPLVKEAVALLEGKHVILSSMNPEIQGIIEDLGYGGIIKRVDAGTDYLHINSSNLGAGKRNYLVEKEIEYRIEENNGELVATVVFTNVNPPSPDWWTFFHFYRNYFRIYAPLGSELISAKSLSNERWDLNARQGEDIGKTYFDGYFEIDQNDRFVAEYRYRLPNTIDINNYKLLVQKQIGEKDTPIKFSIGGKTLNTTLIGDLKVDERSLR